MIKALVGEKEFFRFLELHLPEGLVGRYSDSAPMPKHYFIYKVVVESKETFLGLFDSDKITHEPVGELKKFPGCKSKAGFDEENDQQLLHIIVMDDDYDDFLLDLADDFEDEFDLEATVEDSPKLLEKLKSKRENSQDVL